MQENGINKVIFIAGGLVLSIILGVGGLVGDFAYQGIRFDASGKVYVEQNVPPIISTWSEAALLQRASPKLAQTIDASPGKLGRAFHRLHALGPLQSFGQVAGQSNVSLATLHGKTITAHYEGMALFTRGTATIRVRLIRLPSGWKFQQFTIDSPILRRS